MATQQEVIKNFMTSLDTTTLKGSAAVDAAIRASSNFQSAQDVINNMIRDRNSAGSGDSFLKNYCGIILGNSDTGAITGSDAGSGVTKTGTSVVPNGTFDTSFNGTSFTTRGVTFQLAYVDDEGYRYPLYDFNYLNDSEKHVWQGLKSFWAYESLKLIEESYGYSLTDADSQYRNIRVYFINDPKDATATTYPQIFGTDEKRVYMKINMHYFNSNYVNPNNLDGKCSYWGGTYYLDRLIAHEFTHTVMNAKVNDFSKLPKIIKEGLAELTSGMDDEQYNNIKTAVSSENMLKKLLVLQEDYNEVEGINNEDYVAGYMFLRYLAKQASLQGINISNTKTKAKITGTANADTIENYGANSTISALGGNDFIGSYAAKSSINAGDGNDTIQNTSYGTNTTLLGGVGNDSILNSANARIDAGTGADTITNTNLGGKATLYGGAGNDYITTYNADNVSISGGADNDKMELRGTGKNITVSGGVGNDTISISGGTALIQYSAGDGNDSVIGFNANSTLQIGGGTGTYSSTTSGSNVVVTAGTGKITLTGAAKLSKLNIAGKKVSKDEGKNITNTKSKTLVTGSAYADTLYNNATKVTIDALGGNDSISNRSSGASINGGTGNDTIYNDSIYGDGSRVTIIGGTGKDSISNYAGNVIIYGNEDSDEIYNGTGGNSVTIDGGDGSDEIDSRGANVSIKAGAGNDSIYIDGSKATVTGGSGTDSIRNFGENTLFRYNTGDGNDTIWGFKNNSTLQIDGGSEVSLQTSGSNVIATVGKGKVTLVSAAKVSAINIQGSSGSNTIKSTVSGAKIDGLGGNDKIYNYASSKVTILGGSGADTITNWGAGASMDGGAGDDVIWGDSGNDTLSGGANNDKLHGEAGNDKLYGGTGNDTLWGGSGNDSLWGNAGTDTFIYEQGEGKDVIFGFENTDLLQITGTFSTSYSKSKKEVYFDVGTTKSAITLKDFGSTSSFNVNGTNYKISGTKLVKK